MWSENQDRVRKILILAANPKDTPPLRLDEEHRKIKNALRLSLGRNGYDARVETAVTIPDIRRALLEYEPEIVHFCGHGAGKDGIACEDEKGETHLIPTRALGELFSLVSHVRCVVLNACFAEVQADEVVRYIPHVVGMRREVGDMAALKFAEGFYDALFAGKAFGDCFKWGVNAIALENIPEELTPVLKVKTAKKNGRPRPKKAPPTPAEVHQTTPAEVTGPAVIASTATPGSVGPAKDSEGDNMRSVLSWKSLLAVSLLVIFITASVAWAITSSTTTPPAQPPLTYVMSGYYREQKPEKVDREKDSNFGYRAAGTSLVVFQNPVSKKLQAVETSTWEIYYYPDASKDNMSTKIGGYTVEWLYNETDAAQPGSETVMMDARYQRRLALEVEGAAGEQLQSETIRSQYANEIRSIESGYISADSEMHFTNGGRITRKNWYNGKRGEPNDVSVFIRQ